MKPELEKALQKDGYVCEIDVGANWSNGCYDIGIDSEYINCRCKVGLIIFCSIWCSFNVYYILLAFGEHF